MGIECSECERDARGGHDISCSRHHNNRQTGAEATKTKDGTPQGASELKVVVRHKTDRIVKYVLERHLTCEHDSMHDCNRCLARWIREALRKYA